MWLDYFDKIFLINLDKRADRLERSTALLNEYKIPFTRWAAYSETDKGYFNLIMSMKLLFQHCLNKGHNKILVFEDDVSFLVQPDTLHEIMNLCAKDLQIINWQMFFLGLQHPKDFLRWVTPNILPVEIGYSTHAVAYNKEAMEYVVSQHIDEPIDNFFCREFQKYNTSYCSYPMLCTQEPDYSDIGNSYTDWQPYLLPVFTQRVHPILWQRFKTKMKYNE